MSDFDVIDPRFSRYLLFNADIEQIAESCRWTEGPDRHDLRRVPCGAFVQASEAGAGLFQAAPN